MAFIKRNDQGKVCAVFDVETAGLEKMDFDNPELVEFISRCDSERRYDLLQSDLKLIRVLEDLIDVLISKNIITITDFPQPVINKLLTRRSIRGRLSGAIGMEYEDEK